MALQIWLPLDGDLRNLGCACENASIMGSGISFTDGKIGKAATFPNNPNSCIYIPGLKLQIFSWCVWFKVLGTGAAAYQYILCEGRDVSSIGTNIRLNQTGTTLTWQAHKKIGTASIELNKWYHVALTADGSDLRFYLNGVLQSTTSYSEDSDYTQSSDVIALGKMSYMYTNTSSYFPLNGQLNDIRIYDHCLSSAEVRELAQGLVLHYKLNSEGRDNLLPCANMYTEYSPWTTSFSKADGYAVIPNSAFEAEPSTTYTISFECDGTLSERHITDGSADPNDKLCTFWLYICNVDTTKSWQTGQYDTPVGLYTVNTYRKIGNRHVWTYTLSSTQKYISLRTNTYSDGNTPVIVHWWNIKIEKGTEATPYEYKSESSLITDSSGYGHYAITELSSIYKSGSPRYNTSIYFEGSTAYRIFRTGTAFNYTDNFTYALWLKPDYRDVNHQQFVFVNGRADAGERGYGLRITNDTTLYFYFGNKMYSYVITNNEWVHVVFTKLGNSIKLFKNGEQKANITFDGTLPTYGDGDGLCIGCFRYFDQYARNIYPCFGSVSDFRIYCTALSADAVKDLYQTSVKIDKSGKIHAFEHLEMTSTKVEKTGQMIANDFIEAGYNFHSGGPVSYKPTANASNACAPYNNSFVDLSPVAYLGVPITIRIEADLTWENFGFTDNSEKNFRLQGDSRKKSDGTYTWTNGIGNTIMAMSYITGSSGTAHIIDNKTIPASKFEEFDGFRYGMRTDYSDGNGTLTLSNIKVTLASDITKFNKSYVSANELIER